MVIVIIIVYLLALVFLQKEKARHSLLFTLTGGILLRLYFIELAPFLFDWDEHFHALVAQNLTKHWLLPTLIDKPILPFDYKSWPNNSVWLHKQPLFLWQMALSIKLFGANEFAVRLPSLVMGSILILLVHRIGKMAFSEKTGLIGSALFSCYEPVLELINGCASTDQNDIAFIFYISLSIYCWLCYETKQKHYFMWLMGLCCAMAVLNKWLVGLIVYPGFIFYHLFLVKNFFSKTLLKHFFISLLICFAAVLPWQVYIFYTFPLEARYEFYYSSSHFFKPVEGHSGNWNYYFLLLKDQYKNLHFFIAGGIAYCLYQYPKHKLALALAFIIAVAYVFFSIAATKMPSFVLIAAPLNILFIALLIERLTTNISKLGKAYLIINFLLLSGSLYLFIAPDNIYFMHFAKNNRMYYYRKNKLANKELFEKIKRDVSPGAVLVDFKKWDNVDCMFYTQNTCYADINSNEYNMLKNQKREIIFMGDSLPDFAKDGYAKLMNK